MPPTVAYLAQGKVRLKVGSKPPRTIESPYGNSILEKQVRAQQRNSWKSQGGGFLSGAVLWGSGGAMQGPTPVYITSISSGAEKGRLIYSMESGSLCALLATENLGDEEKRLWNNNNFKLHHVSACPHTGNLAFSIVHSNGTANIGVMLKGETGVKELTEGDSVDTAPQWLTGEPRRIIFQSAGIGRDRHGHFLALGPFSIQELNLDSAELGIILEDERTDYVSPRVTADETMYYIRRPCTSQGRVSPLKSLKDIVFFPFRLGYAIFQYLNFFSVRYTGRKLTTAGDARAREMDMKQMMIWGNIINAQQAAESEEAADLVPASWQLARRRAGSAEEILARNVLAYDLGEDGTIAYSNGNAIFLLSPDGRKERLVSERMIEQVVILGA